ncbi:MAG: MiaB/RimO family radical SAM methylthiotransferase, partial [Candidatus Omnitrophica bacterium]|nr:MiaB/RimO family radical SAM methylthiotransferase [Candidatus Omnitrophota bacterium]
IPKIISEVSDSELFKTKIWETESRERPEEIYHTGFYEDKDHAYVVISEGCSNYCSYCVVPFVRGELHNRAPKDIINEIEEAVKKGINKITLLGQNVNAYQSPAASCQLPVNFIKLLKLINETKGLKEFTFVTSHPKDTSVELFKIMAECDKLKKNLHLPVQSGSDRILELMNRGYTKKKYLDLVKAYRKEMPAGTITTDIIVGFPTESSEDFQQTHDLMKEAGFDAAYIFKYSPRPHTQAEHYADDVPKAEKERRHKALLDFIKAVLVVIMLCVSMPARAELDIFDHPRQIERKKAVIVKKDDAKLLDYPNECFLKGEYEATFRSCQKLLEYKPAQGLKLQIMYLMGLSCLKLNRFLEARSYFNDVTISGAAGDDLKRDASLGIADSYFLDDKLDEAAGAYKEILGRYPPTEVGSIVYYRLYEISHQQGREEEAQQYLSRLKREFPFSFEAQLKTEEPKSYSVQAGCFNSKRNTDRFCEKLVSIGFDAYIVESPGVEEPRYRVKAGRFNSKEEAEAVKVKLKNAGYPARVSPEK